MLKSSSHLGPIPFAFLLADVLLIAYVVQVGWMGLLMQLDTSGISILIVCLYLVHSAFLVLIPRLPKSTYPVTLAWFMVGLFSSLGLFGTVYGFVMILFDLFDKVDFENLSTARTVISQMTTGMGVAMLTTLTGVAANILGSIKMVVLGYED